MLRIIWCVEMPVILFKDNQNWFEIHMPNMESWVRLGATATFCDDIDLRDTMCFNLWKKTLKRSKCVHWEKNLRRANEFRYSKLRPHRCEAFVWGIYGLAHESSSRYQYNVQCLWKFTKSQRRYCIRLVTKEGGINMCFCECWSLFLIITWAFNTK